MCAMQSRDKSSSGDLIGLLVFGTAESACTAKK